MTSKIFLFSTCILVSAAATAQKSKVQSAWRALSDYESTLGDKPDTSYLMKANRNIDLALADESTKNQAKTHAYKARIMYYVYQYNLKEENKKLETSISDKNARAEASYGNTPTREFEVAANSIETIKKNDAKYFQNILDIVKGGSANSESDDDLKLSNVAMQLKVESSNIAVGKYKVKQYNEAADFFYRSASLAQLLYNKTDTSDYYNACVAAQKSKDPAKVVLYNQKMIDMNISSPFNYRAIYEIKNAEKDSVAAMQYLKDGRLKYPNDVYLMNEETNYYIQHGMQDKALANLQSSISKDPENPLLQYVIGNIYDNLSNPKTKSGKDTTKPADYENLVAKAAEHYLKSIELKGTNQENYFNSLYNLGALYNNYGNTLYSKSMEKATIVELVKKQKEMEAKSAESYKKAIPYLERALELKPNDKGTISALRTLYYKTGNEAKGKEMDVLFKK